MISSGPPKNATTLSGTKPANNAPSAFAGEMLPRCSYWELFLWILRRRSRFRVTGNSMTPLLQSGEEILVDPQAYRRIAPQPGDLVINIPNATVCNWSNG